MAEKKRYAEYLRKSRYDDPQKSIEEVLRRHKELLDEFQKKEGIYVAPEDIYEEVVSGDSLYARPQMLKLLEAVENGRYEAVLCVDIQRLGRGSMSDQGAILDAFKFSGTKIITPGRTYDLSDELDETYTEFETFMGRQELRMIKKRLARGKAKTVEDGGYCANAPYGYKKAYINRKPTLEIVEEEANIVRIIFDCYANQNMGGQRIADYITSLGAQPRRGVSFARTTVLKILRNPVYIGKIAWYRDSYIRKGTKGNEKQLTIHHPREEWTVVEGLHQPIVDEELFQKAQRRLAARTHNPYFTGEISNPLAGIVVCKHCGATLQRQGCRGGPLLLCLKRGCNVSSKLEYVEDALLYVLEAEAKRIKVDIESGKTETEDDSAEKELQAVEVKLKKAQGQLAKLHDLVEQGVYDVATFVARRDKLQDRIKTLTHRKEGLLLRCGRPKNVEKMYRAICDVLEKYPGSSTSQKNAMLKGLIESVTYEKKPGALPREFRLEVHLRPQY